MSRRRYAWVAGAVGGLFLGLCAALVFDDGLTVARLLGWAAGGLLVGAALHRPLTALAELLGGIVPWE